MAIWKFDHYIRYAWTEIAHPKTSSTDYYGGGGGGGGGQQLWYIYMHNNYETQVNADPKASPTDCEERHQLPYIANYVELQIHA